MKRNAKNYFKKFENNPELVTLSGLTRAIGMTEEEYAEFVGDADGRKVLLDVYLQLAEIFETNANLKPNAHRTSMLQALNKFTGGLYTLDKITQQSTVDAQVSFRAIPQESQKKLMEVIAKRSINKD